MVEKTQAINAKHGPFTAAFLIGDVFQGDEPSDDESALLNGSLESTLT